MKKQILLLMPLLAVALYLAPLYNLRLGDEGLPEIELPAIDTKRALVMVAHDDDAAAMTGLIHKLVNEGWEVHFATFYQSEDTGYRASEIPLRKRELQAYVDFLGISTIHSFDFQMRKSLQNGSLYLPISTDSLNYFYYVDSLKSLIQETFTRVRPAVVLSLDSDVGGYGHPEHVLVAKHIQEICAATKSVKQLYQVVFTDKQEKQLNSPQRTEAMVNAYGYSDMPPPNVRLDVGQMTAVKMQGLKIWDSQKRNLRKFFPYYLFYPHQLYFRVANQEYYRLIAY